MQFAVAGLFHINPNGLPKNRFVHDADAIISGDEVGAGLAMRVHIEATRAIAVAGMQKRIQGVA